MADASQNQPMKELTFTLVGVGAFLAIVLLIGVSAWLRPAGEHMAPEPTAEEAAETVAADDAAAAEATEEAAEAEAALWLRTRRMKPLRKRKIQHK